MDRFSRRIGDQNEAGRRSVDYSASLRIGPRVDTLHRINRWADRVLYALAVLVAALFIGGVI
jgi:hypothetical protein